MGNLAAAGRWDGGVMGRGRLDGAEYWGGATAAARWEGAVGWLGIARAAVLRDDWEFASVAGNRWIDEPVDRMDADRSRQTGDGHRGGGRWRVDRVVCGLPLAATKHQSDGCCSREADWRKGRREADRRTRVAHSDFLGVEINQHHSPSSKIDQEVT